jgi:hypothetical protein
MFFKVLVLIKNLASQSHFFWRLYQITRTYLEPSRFNTPNNLSSQQLFRSMLNGSSRSTQLSSWFSQWESTVLTLENNWIQNRTRGFHLSEKQLLKTESTFWKSKYWKLDRVNGTPQTWFSSLLSTGLGCRIVGFFSNLWNICVDENP